MQVCNGEVGKIYLCTTMGATPALLRLPRELRDEIYYCLLDHRDEAPFSPIEAGPRISQGTLQLQPAHDSVAWRTRSLTSTNRQLREEIRELISTTWASEHKPFAELDVMFEHHYERHGLKWQLSTRTSPTWIQFPAAIRPDVPFDLRLHMRVFFASDQDNRAASRKFQGLQIRNSCLEMVLLLKRLVRFGPGFQPRHAEAESDGVNIYAVTQHRPCFKIGTLSVDLTNVSTYNQGLTGTNSYLLRTFTSLARSGLARSAIENIDVRWRHHPWDGSPYDANENLVVRQDIDEEHMRFCVEWGFCQSMSDSLETGTLDAGPNRESGHSLLQGSR